MELSQKETLFECLTHMGTLEEIRMVVATEEEEERKLLNLKAGYKGQGIAPTLVEKMVESLTKQGMPMEKARKMAEDRAAQFIVAASKDAE